MVSACWRTTQRDHSIAQFRDTVLVHIRDRIRGLSKLVLRRSHPAGANGIRTGYTRVRAGGSKSATGSAAAAAEALAAGTEEEDITRSKRGVFTSLKDRWSTSLKPKWQGHFGSMFLTYALHSAAYSKCANVT